MFQLLLSSSLGLALSSRYYPSSTKKWSPQKYRLDSNWGERRLQDSPSCQESIQGLEWGPLRIKVEYVDVEADLGSTSAVAYLRDELMPAALGFFESALSVRQLAEPLRVDRFCSSTWNGGLCASAGSAPCGSVSGQDMVIPEAFIKPLDLYSCTSTCSVSETLPGGEGAPNTDFLVLVSAKQDAACGSGGQGTVAFANACYFDQCDRPLAGKINFCPLMFDFDTERARASLVSTAIHELVHALAFSSDMYSYFRMEDGTPRVARDSNGSPANEVRWSCNGVQATFPDAQGGWAYSDPVGVVAMGSARGVTEADCPCPVGVSKSSEEVMQCIAPPRGQCILKIVTPKVVEKVREWFNCPSLDGAELENQVPGEYRCEIMESHWETRLFHTELMVPSGGYDIAYINPVTLALFEDSGWYKADYSYASSSPSFSIWGQNEGCAFVDSPCIQNGAPISDEFCSEPVGMAEYTCSPDHKYLTQCNAAAGYAPADLSFYSYLGGSDGSTPVIQNQGVRHDYCPTFTGISQTECSDPSSASQKSEFMGELFQASSRCLMSSFMVSQQVNGGYTFYPNSAYSPGCYKVQCSSDGSSYSIIVASSSGAERALTDECSSEGQIIQDLEEYSVEAYPAIGNITCASPSAICTSTSHPYLGAAPSDVGTAPPSPSSVSQDQGEEEIATPSPAPSEGDMGVDGDTPGSGSEITASGFLLMFALILNVM